MASDKKSIVRRIEVPASVSKPVVTPLFPSVVYSSASADELDAQYEGRVQGFTYSREGHPNAAVLASQIDTLERAENGLIVSSGMAAISTLMLTVLQSGDHVVAGNQLYGRSLRMLQHCLPDLGIETTFVDPGDRDSVESAVKSNTRLMLFEIVANPTLRIADMACISEIAKSHEVLLAIDNTFTTPRAFQPFVHGADIVIHSITKLLGGHSDVMLGYVAASDRELQSRLYGTAVTWGFAPSPFDCWLAERGLHSFELRYDRAQSNAARLADHLAEQVNVELVLYPGRSDHPDFELAKQLLGEQTGNMVSFRIAGGREAANALIAAAPNIPFAPTLGDVATTLSHPASSSHRGLTPAQRAAIGISEGFFRISVGIEDIELLCEEFSAAISAATG